jgi:hypothetical protein
MAPREWLTRYVQVSRIGNSDRQDRRLRAEGLGLGAGTTSKAIARRLGA